jgi:hypothetical protein
MRGQSLRAHGGREQQHLKFKIKRAVTLIVLVKQVGERRRVA